MFEPGLLSNKRILVTGGGTGLGRSIAARYSELGASVIICGRRPEVLSKTADEIRHSTGNPVDTHVCDIRSADAVDAMFSQIFSAGPIDGLVNNAAANFIAQTHRLSPRAIDAVLNTVLHGTMYCTVAAGRRWIETGRPGCVLSILSLGGIHGAPFTVPSATAKAGILAMTRGLSVEWGSKNIRLVAVAPGLFPTPGATQNLRPDNASDDQVLHRDIPLRRFGHHRELADLCSYLISDRSGYITGEVIAIDGGKQWLGGARVVDSSLLDWSDNDWDALRQRMGKS